MIYLDNAATTSPKPRSVMQAVSEAMRTHTANPGRSGHSMSLASAELVYDARVKVADFFGCPKPEHVVFTSGCTMSANMVLKGILRPGDHFIISSLEHNAVSRPANTLMKSGVKMSVARIVPGDDAATLNNFKAVIRPNTRLIMTTHASNVFGVIVPIALIGRLCRERGILLGVDAAQTAGILPISCERMGIDFLCVAAHKGLYAPMGCGILICGEHPLAPFIEGGTGTQSLEQEQPAELPERLESGTLNVPGIAGIAAGIDFIKSQGIERIYRHEMELMHRLYTELKRMPIKLYTGGGVQSVPVLSFNVSGMDSFSAASLLDSKGIAVRSGLQCAPMAHRQFGTLPNGTIRVCPSVFTSPRDIDMLLQALKNIINGKF